MMKLDAQGRILSATAVPAYGRDYPSAELAEAAFKSGKDWILQPEGRYFGIGDCAPGAKVRLRYAKKRRVTVFEVTL